METQSILVISIAISLFIIIFLILKICDMHKTNNQLKTEIAEAKKDPYAYLITPPYALSADNFRIVDCCANFSISFDDAAQIRHSTAYGVYEAYIKDNLSKTFAKELIKQDLIIPEECINPVSREYTYKARLKLAVKD
ncbi:MAG: hypothetical protein MJ237_09415 [bacterium]|nr:hypothetical protein [bacterium]